MLNADTTSPSLMDKLESADEYYVGLLTLCALLANQEWLSLRFTSLHLFTLNPHLNSLNHLVRVGIFREQKCVYFLCHFLLYSLRPRIDTTLHKARSNLSPPDTQQPVGCPWCAETSLCTGFWRQYAMNCKPHTAMRSLLRFYSNIRYNFRGWKAISSNTPFTIYHASSGRVR